MKNTTMQAIFFDLGDTLVNSATRSWLPGAKEMLATLAARPIKLGVISNTGQLTRTELAAFLPPDFDWNVFTPTCVLLSAEAGVEKPSPSIFQLACTRADLPPAQCMFCTENWIDTLVAQRVGMVSARVLPPPNSDIAQLVKVCEAAGLLAPPATT